MYSYKKGVAKSFSHTEGWGTQCFEIDFNHRGGGGGVCKMPLPHMGDGHDKFYPVSNSTTHSQI